MKIGFIGTGHMGSILARIVRNNSNDDLYFANRTIQKAQTLANELNGHCVTNSEIAQTCNLVFLGIKPQQANDVLNELKKDFEANKNIILVSMMTAWSTKRIKDIVDIPVIRIMPNTPMEVSEGICLYDYSKDVNQDDLNNFLNLLKGSGLLIKLDEELINAASAVSGCGPAFADMFIDALAAGAINCGIQKEIAIKLATQMLIGASKLLEKSNKEPDELKKEVCSPGGSTIEGVKVLEDNNFKQIVMAAVKASCDKNKKL